MPLSYMSAKLKPNATNVFSFPGNVASYAAGVASFLFTFGDDDDHHIEELSLSILANKPSPTQVSVTVTGTLKDGSGNEIDVDKSYVTVVVLAWVGASNGTLLLSPQQTEGNGQQSGPIYLPGLNPPILQSSLSGFDLSYAPKDHHVEGVNVGVGAGMNGNQGYLTAIAKMWDSSGNDAVNPTATGTLLASSDQNPGFIIKTYTAQDVGQQNIKMGTPLKGAVSLLTSFKVQYKGDHHVKTIGAGPDVTRVDTGDPSLVITSGVWAWMYDGSGNNQDNSLSNATVIIIGFTS